MRVITVRCEEKLRDGRELCGLSLDYKEGLARLELESGPILAVWHGDYGDGLKRFLQADSQRYVLVVGNGVAEINDHEFPGNECPGHLRSFRLESISSWQEHPAWKREALTRFFNKSRQEGVSVPPWTVLIPPVAPEHVVACYLCCLAGIDPEPAWAKGFEEELSYWITERKVNPVPNWDRDRADKETLRAFLVAVGMLQGADSGRSDVRI
jgi:hypothetical protein